MKLSILVLIVFLGGCATNRNTIKTNIHNDSHVSSFLDGYIEGWNDCALNRKSDVEFIEGLIISIERMEAK